MSAPVNVTIDVASYGMPVAKFLDWLRGGLGGAFCRVADDIEAQIQPAVNEPHSFGAVVEVINFDGRRSRWCRTYSVTVDEPWCTGNHNGSWAEVVEQAVSVTVLWPGIGDAA